MRKRIVKYLSCLIPNKKLRKRFRKRFENSKPNIELLNQKIELLDYKLNLFLNHFVNIKDAKLATGNLRYNQNKRFEVLKIVAKLLEENDIKYWLDFGTLIGAVRHGGWIPWDNDLDISIHQDDWDKMVKFLTRYFKDSNEYMFIDVLKIKGCKENTFIKGCKENTFFKIIGKVDGYNYLDFFLYVNAPDKENAICCAVYLAKEKYTEKNSDYCAHRFNINTVFPLKKMKFEGIDFNVPNSYERYLNILYADYMLFPNSINISAELERKLHVKDIN